MILIASDIILTVPLNNDLLAIEPYFKSVIRHYLAWLQRGLF